MNNVIDFSTGEPIKFKHPPKRKVVQEVVEGLYQRRHQIEDIAIGYFEKSTGQFRFVVAATDNLTMRLIQLNMHSQFENCADLE